MKSIALNKFSKMRTTLIALLLLFIIPNCSCKGKNKNIKIGLLAGMSGRISQLGVQCRNGAMLAIDEINSSGGINNKKLQLIVKDHMASKKNLKSSINAFRKDEVTVIIGPVLSQIAQSTVNMKEAHGILIVSPAANTDLLSNKDDNFFRIMPEASRQGKLLAAIARRKGNIRAAVIYDSSNEDYTKAVYDGFKKIFLKKRGRIVYTNSLQKKGFDSYALIAREIVKTNADSVILICSSIDAASIAQQLWKKQSNVAKYGSTWASTPDIIPSGGRAVEEMVFISTYYENRESQEYKRVSIKYNNYYKTEMSFIAEYSYEVVKIIAEAIEKTGSVDTADLKRYFLKKRKFQGLRDIISLNKYGDAHRRYSYITIRNGKFQVVK